MRPQFFKSATRIKVARIRDGKEFTVGEFVIKDAGVVMRAAKFFAVFAAGVVLYFFGSDRFAEAFPEVLKMFFDQGTTVG
jgi:hypothetical protein